MQDLYFILGLLFILGFWLFDGYKLLRFYSEVEAAKKWIEREANLVNIKNSIVTKKPSSGFFARFFRVLFSPERFNIFAYFYEGEVKIGVYNFSLYPRYNRHISFRARALFREMPERITVYSNPEAPQESIIIPPSEHKIVGKIVWFGIKTFLLTFLMLYLFF